MTRSEIFRNNYKYQAEESRKKQKDNNKKSSETKRKVKKEDYTSIFRSEDER